MGVCMVCGFMPVHGSGRDQTWSSLSSNLTSDAKYKQKQTLPQATVKGSCPRLVTWSEPACRRTKCPRSKVLP